RAFARAVEGRLAPGVERVQALLGFAFGARILAVHVDAVRAAVDLRGAHLHEAEQAVLQARAVDVFLQLHHRLDRFRGNTEVVDTGCHCFAPVQGEYAR